MATATINKTRVGTADTKVRTLHRERARIKHPYKKGPASEPGRFGVYGGRYVPETLMAALDELDREYEKAKGDRKFQQRLGTVGTVAAP